MRRQRLNDGWEVRPKVSLFAELAGGGTAEWEPVPLPHDAMIGSPRSEEAGPANAYFPGGSWEYRRTITVPEDGVAGAVVLDFEGVYRDAVVSVNGVVVTRRPYGYARFHVPIDHLLDPGDNVVTVEATAGADSRWYSGAGIHRDVWLLESGRVHLSAHGVSIRTPEVDADGAVVTVAATVVNQTASLRRPTLRVELVDPDETVVAGCDTPVTSFPNGSVELRPRLLVDGPRRWSPDDPQLYRCTVSLLDGDEVIDTDDSTFGIRSLALDARRGLRINGEPVLLRGACVHHDNGLLGTACFERADERRVERLKEAGFNAIRSAHNPMSRAMLDACDRHGVLVMDETFDMWLQAKSDDDYARRFEDWWEEDVEAMVRNAQNHPSVVFYSIGNEIPDGSTSTGLQVGRRLVEKVRSLDDSRYVTQAVTGILVGGPELFADLRESMSAEPTDEAGVNTIATTLGDIMRQVVRSPVVDAETIEAFAPLDVAGYNYMESRYQIDAELHPDRVIVGTETYPAAIADGWALVEALPNVIGDFTWTGWDYLGEVGVGRSDHSVAGPDEAAPTFHGGFPWRTAWCGDFDIAGQRRPQSYYREIVFGLRADPYVAVLRPEHDRRPSRHESPWAWPDVVSSWSWPGHEGEVVEVEVYAAADEVELVCNGRSVGRLPAGEDHEYRARFELPYEPGELEVIGRVDDDVVGRCVLRTASDALRLEVAPDREDIRVGGGDLAFVDIALVDEDAIVHTTQDRRVEVAVDGPGVVQALGSADPNTDEPLSASACTTFDGRALAAIRATGAGTITVTVTAVGCEPVRAIVRSS